MRIRYLPKVYNLSYNHDNKLKSMLSSAKNQLIEIGLNEYEAGVYLVLVEHSPSSAAFVAKKLQQSRSTVYTALERLIAKGLVGTTYKNEVKQFIAEPVSAVEELLQREKKELDDKFKLFSGLAEHLKLLSHGSARIPNIIFFEGQDSLKKIYLDMLRSAAKGSTMLVVRDAFMWEKEWSFLFEDAWNDKVRRLRTENDISTKLLINGAGADVKNIDYYKKRKHLEFRLLPKSHPIDKFVVYILHETVSILSMEQNNLVGIKITNRHIAKNFEQVFGTMWESSKVA